MPFHAPADLGRQPCPLLVSESIWTCSGPAPPPPAEGCFPLAHFPLALWCGLPVGPHPVRTSRCGPPGPARPTRAARTPSSESDRQLGPHSLGTARRRGPRRGQDSAAARTPRRRASRADPACSPQARAGTGEEVSPQGGLVPDSLRGLPASPRPGPPSSRVALGNVARTPRKELARLLGERAAALPPVTLGRPGRYSPGLHRELGARRTPRCSGAVPGRCGARFRELHGPPRPPPGPSPATHPAGRQGAGRGGVRARPGGSERPGRVGLASRPAPRAGRGPGSA